LITLTYLLKRKRGEVPHLQTSASYTPMFMGTPAKKRCPTAWSLVSRVVPVSCMVHWAGWMFGNNFVSRTLSHQVTKKA